MDLKQVINSVAQFNRETEQKAEETFQIVVFELDCEEYGIEITDIREIIKTQTITPVPNSAEFIRGILNLRGKIVVVVDLEKRFSLSREKEKDQQHIIVTEVGENNFGVLVDKVTEVLRVPVSKIQATPSLVSTKIHADYLKGVVVLEKEESIKTSETSQSVKGSEISTAKASKSRLILLIDLPKLLNESNLLELGEEIKKETKTQNEI